MQRSAVDKTLGHLKTAIAVLVVLAVAAAAALPFLGGTFMPDFREGHFVMQVSSSVTGTSLDEMLSVGQRISKQVLALPYVQSIEQQVGRAELSEDNLGAASKRIPRRAQTRCQGRSERGPGGAARDSRELSRNPRVKW